MSRKHNKYGYIPNQNYNFNSPLPIESKQGLLDQMDITDDFEINFNESGSELSGRFMIAIRKSTGEVLFRSKYDEKQCKFVDVNIKGQYLTNKQI